MLLLYNKYLHGSKSNSVVIFCGFFVLSQYLLSKWNTMEHEQDNLRPPQILLKPEWGKMLAYLSTKDTATVFRNIFKYYEEQPLEKMSPMAAMFFTRVEEVMNYNNQRYQTTVIRNRTNGSKSKGRPSTQKPNETQENPVGIVGYPNNPKDKATGKSKDKPKEIDRAEDKSTATLKEAQVEILEQQLAQLVSKSWGNIQDKEEANFIQSCQLLAEEVSWERFRFMLLEASKNELEQLVKMFNISLSAADILELRKHCYYYLNKLIPQLP